MKSILFALSTSFISTITLAATSVSMYMVDDKGLAAPIGQIEITESSYGIVFTPSLKNVMPGLHGFHLHQNPSCDPMEKEGKAVPALAAGGHYDPLKSNKHDFPWTDGHLGDLPALYVDASGNANQPVLAPRLKASDLQDHALIIHIGADNHADHPAPLGGGGARMACGVIN